MPRCWPCSPTANRGRARRWRWRSAPARAPCSGRSMQLAAAGKVQSFGRGRARRWMTPPVPGFPTMLVTPRPAAERLGWNDMKRSAQPKSFANMDPFPDVDGVHGVSFDGQLVWFASGDRLNALDPASGKVGALDRCRRACGNGLRRPAPLPDRRGSHPEDRSRRPARCSAPSRRPAAAAFGARLGRRDALGRPVPRTEDPSDRSGNRARPSHHRIRPLRHRCHLGRRRALARHLGRRRRAMSGASIPKRERCSSSLDMPAGPACRGSNPTAATGSSAAAEAAAR